MKDVDFQAVLGLAWLSDHWAFLTWLHTA